MSDNKNVTGQQDRSRISAHEDYEVRALATKFNLDLTAARSAIEKYGPMRADVEAALQKQRNN